MNTEEKVRGIRRIIITVVVTLALISSVGTVSAGQVGVKTRLGKVVGTVQPGVYMKIPFMEKVSKLPVNTLTINYDKAGDSGDEKNSSDNLFAASSDLQDVAIGVVVNYHIDPARIMDVYTQYHDAPNFQANVVDPMVREIVKSTAGLYSAEALVTRRTEFSDAVNKNLAERLVTKGAVLERSSVTNFEFSRSFSRAIEAKVTAVQEAEAAKNKLEQVKYESEQTIVAAQGVAEAQRIKSQALNSQGGEALVRLTIAERWDGHLPQTMVPGAGVPLLNIK